MDIGRRQKNTLPGEDFTVASLRAPPLSLVGVRRMVPVSARHA